MKIKSNIAISENGFLFDPATGESFSTNETGREILELMKQGKTEDEIKTIMTERFEVEAQAFERYYLDFIGMLKQYQIITE
jgi:hypothetical protein